MNYHFYYRLYFKVNNQEYSYVGTTTNLKKRINKHLWNLKQVLNLKKDDNNTALIFYHYVIKNQKLPSKKALYYKLALFMLKYNLTINDLHIEELVVKDNLNLKNFYYRNVERYLIKKYHGFKYGFNGLLGNYYLKNINCAYLEDDYQIALEIINQEYSLNYLKQFWWSHLGLANVVNVLGAKLKLEPKSYSPFLQKIVDFSNTNLKFINNQIRFYQEKYNNSEIIKK